MLPIVNEARQRPKTAQVSEASQIPGKNGGGQGSGYYGYGYNGRGQKHKSIFIVVDNFGQVWSIISGTYNYEGYSDWNWNSNGGYWGPSPECVPLAFFKVQ